VAQNVPLNAGDPALESFFDATQEMLSGAAINFEVVLLNSTTVQVPAGVGHDQVSLSIGVVAQYRYVTSPVDRAHPGGAAGIYDMYATSAANDPTTGVPVGGSYAFALAIVAAAATPVGVSLYRKVGHLTWDGSAITSLVQDAGPAARSDPRFGGVVPIGGTISYGGGGDPPGGTWLLADGRLIDKTTYAAYFAAVGHKYNGGVDPGANKVRIIDSRGRGLVGADNMGTAQGAAGRLPNSNRVAGQTGGEERVTLALAEMPSHSHFFQMTNGFGAPSGQDVPFCAEDQGVPVSLFWNTMAAGSSASHNNMPPYAVDNVIVRVR
jgi:microcystin-dependent protein